MSIDLLRALAILLFAVCACLFSLSAYYFTAMAHAVDRQLSPSKWTWLFVWSAAQIFHRRYFPESQLRKKWFYSTLGMWLSGILGFVFWTK
jgi:hypothetical protein